MDNAIDINKGEKINLQKVSPGIKVARIGAMWNKNKVVNGHPFDMDISVVCVDANGQAFGTPGFVFYKNLKNENGSIIVTKDNRTGEGDGYDEEAFIKFDSVPAAVKSIYVCASIAMFITRKQNFGQIDGAKIDMYNEDTRERLISFDLTEDMSSGAGCKCIRFMRETDGSWSYKAVGEIVQGGLKGILNGFGLDVIGEE